MSAFLGVAGTVKVALTFPECEQAAMAGAKRRVLALRDRRPAAYGYQEDDTWKSDIESSGAELAVAKFLGLYWLPWAERLEEVRADVGDCVEVRWRSRRGYDLPAHPEDPDCHYYVLVYGSIPEFELVGWTTGWQAKQPQTWHDNYVRGRPAFWTPQAALSQDWESLKAMARGLTP